MFDIGHVVGLGAAIGSSIAFFPQVIKVWRTKQTDHLSLITFLVLMTAVSLWIVYGVIRSDAIIIGANIMTVAMLAYLVTMKVVHLARRKAGAVAVASTVEAHPTEVAGAPGEPVD